jgi:acyl carrier protein
MNPDVSNDRMKKLIVDSLHLEGLEPASIGDDAPLFGEGLGLDSVDALELVVAMEKEFGLKIEGHKMDKAVFTSVSSLTRFVQKQLTVGGSATK